MLLNDEKIASTETITFESSVFATSNEACKAKKEKKKVYLKLGKIVMQNVCVLLACLFVLIYLENEGILVFLTHFFLFCFAANFSWQQLPPPKKNLGSVHRVMQQKWVHIGPTYVSKYVRQTFFSSLPNCHNTYVVY